MGASMTGCPKRLVWTVNARRHLRLARRQHNGRRGRHPGSRRAALGQYGDGIPWYAEGAGTLTKIFNADTLEIDGEKFQLSLTNAPEGKQWGAVRAMALVEAVCRVGSTVYYDH